MEQFVLTVEPEEMVDEVLQVRQVEVEQLQPTDKQVQQVQLFT
tara:strand:- start:496 stop:624 length:129 start_codon:yes stop_codon:yes gene_type:complete